MEMAIPPKPTAWQVFSEKYLKWVGLGLLLLTLATLFMFWRKDRLRIEQLSKQIAIAQQQVKDLAERQASVFETNRESQNVATNKLSQGNTTEALTAAKAKNEKLLSKVHKHNQPTSATQGNEGIRRSKVNNTVANLTAKAATNAEVIPSSTQLIEKSKEAEQVVVRTAATQVEMPKIQSLEGAQITGQSIEERKLPMLLPTAYALVSSMKNQAPAVKHFGHRPNRKPYPRISVEVGSAAFAMPLARLFNRDTNYAGAIKPSWGANFALHYELSPSLALHGGYEFKNIRTSKMALRYHSMPMLVSKNLRLGHRLNLEAKAGLTVNKFFNHRTYSDGISVRGRKDLWLGWQASAQFVFPMSKDVLLLIGPYGGSSITTFANSKRTWETGLATNIRYQF
ncbi:MAG: hypothetical protein IPN76_15745 [Saprospiraceae bacterium]|nr:hypothetical protein [Saprospiraceae bacterium]